MPTTGVRISKLTCRQSLRMKGKAKRIKQNLEDSNISLHACISSHTIGMVSMRTQPLSEESLNNITYHLN